MGFFDGYEFLHWGVGGFQSLLFLSLSVLVGSG